mmetsp:Transcript_22892/g.58385  ORF Transcript_22892/g.58385 Transcript_22892/m.58385 type:complete len:220 (-) Transcript_22892:324-983(-)
MATSRALAAATALGSTARTSLAVGDATGAACLMGMVPLGFLTASDSILRRTSRSATVAVPERVPKEGNTRPVPCLRGASSSSSSSSSSSAAASLAPLRLLTTSDCSPSSSATRTTRMRSSRYSTVSVRTASIASAPPPSPPLVSILVSDTSYVSGPTARRLPDAAVVTVSRPNALDSVDSTILSLLRTWRGLAPARGWEEKMISYSPNSRGLFAAPLTL